METLLDTVDFHDIARIIKQYNLTDILPQLQKVRTCLDMDATMLDMLSQCSSITHLISPHCRSLNDSVLQRLTSLQSLTLPAGVLCTPRAFMYLHNLKELQILSHSRDHYDTLLDHESIAYMKQLEMLHIRSLILCNDHICQLENLKVLVLEDNDKVTPDILNHLPKLELCVINRKILKFVASDRNHSIIRKIGSIT